MLYEVITPQDVPVRAFWSVIVYDANGFIPENDLRITSYNVCYTKLLRTMTMADNYLQFLAKNTDWSKRRLIDRDDFIKFGYKYNDSLA